MTEYIHRVTIACPEVMIADANQLALVVGESAADVNTFTAANYQTDDGQRYAVASTVAKPALLELAAGSLEAPDYAPEADIEAAQRAQAALLILDSLEDLPEMDGTQTIAEDLPTLDGSQLVAVVDLEPQAAIAALGLQRADPDAQ